MKKIDKRSFLMGALTAFLLTVSIAGLSALDFGKIANAGGKIAKGVESLTGIKSNLEKDVVNLTDDSKLLIKNKDTIVDIKNQLLELANQTQKQIGQINATIKVVEDNLVKTQKDIASTSAHVQDIDKAKKILQ